MTFAQLEKLYQEYMQYAGCTREEAKQWVQNQARIARERIEKRGRS